MPARRPSDARPRVFINCPFDDDYGDLLRALAFTIAACGYKPTCALDEDDAGRIRFDKLKALIAEADLAIHESAVPKTTLLIAGRCRVQRLPAKKWLVQLGSPQPAS